jgi:hypothetical protein
MRVRFAYLMTDEPARVDAVAPDHARHWRSLGLSEYAGGPFSDRPAGSSPSPRQILRKPSVPSMATRSCKKDPCVSAGSRNPERRRARHETR